MFCSINSVGIWGIQGSTVVSECFISNGLPAFDIVGLPDAAVKEARERVRAEFRFAVSYRADHREFGTCQSEENRNAL